MGDYDRFVDTIVDVIDPRTGRLLVSTRLPGVLWLVPDRGIVYRWSETEDGVITLKLYRLRVKD